MAGQGVHRPEPTTWSFQLQGQEYYVDKSLGDGGFGKVMSVRRVDEVFAAKIGKTTISPHRALLWLVNF